MAVDTGGSPALPPASALLPQTGTELRGTVLSRDFVGRVALFLWTDLLCRFVPFQV
jgi:hypothetical protein